MSGRETYGEEIVDGRLPRCDSLGCIAEGPAGFTLAVIADPAGFYEDCGSVDLVVTPPLRAAAAATRRW